MTKLRTFSLENCIEDLIDYRGKSPPKAEAGIPVISAKVVKNGRLLPEIKQRIEPSFYHQWMTRGFPKKGDIVLTTEGPLGEVAQLDDESATFALGQRVVVLRGKKNILDNTFLKFLLMSPRQQEILAAYATGTTVAGISQKALRSVPISVPSYSEQLAIGSLLGFLEDKMDVNHRMNQTLVAVAQVLFKDWFVDFSPVRAKMEGRQPPGLSPEIVSLFPDALCEHGKPVNWKQRRICEIANIVKGKSYKSSELAPSKTALVTLKSFKRQGGYRLDGLKEFTGQYKPEQEVRTGDLIIAYTDVTQAAEVIGRPALVMSDVRYERFVISLDVGVLQPQKDEYRFWLYGLMMTDEFQHYTRAHTTGTTVLHLSSNAIPKFEFAFPGDSLVCMYHELVEPIFRQIDTNVTENHSLLKMRDLLLPQLLSGKIYIKDAEKIIGGAS